MKSIFYVVLSALFFNCSSNKQTESKNQVKTLSVLTLQRDSITLYSEYPAHIEGKVNVDIRPQAEGYIEKILVEEGMYVKAGQPLFKIDDRVYIEQLNSAKASLASALAALQTAKLEITKQTLLADHNVNSGFQLKLANAQYETAKANVQQQQAAVDLAKINLNFTTVKAPVSGYIGRIPKRIGNMVSKSDALPLTTLSEISEVYAYFSMTEKEYLQLVVNNSKQDVQDKISGLKGVSLVLADGTAYSYKGKVEMINGEFESGTGSISLRADFPNPQNVLRTGNTGRIIIPRTEQNVLLVPVLATLDIQNKVQVIRLKKDNTAERISINVSQKQGDFYVVKSGLNPGDKIVIQSLTTVQDGELIQPEVK
nr:efflux RND transporter periplasmic adaptor subunit [uncultured Bacteroides sp.]